MATPGSGHAWEQTVPLLPHAGGQSEDMSLSPPEVELHSRPEPHNSCLFTVISELRKQLRSWAPRGSACCAVKGDNGGSLCWPLFCSGTLPCRGVPPLSPFCLLSSALIKSTVELRKEDREGEESSLCPLLGDSDIVPRICSPAPQHHPTHREMKFGFLSISIAMIVASC